MVKTNMKETTGSREGDLPFKIFAILLIVCLFQISVDAADKVRITFPT